MTANKTNNNKKCRVNVKLLSMRQKKKDGNEIVDHTYGDNAEPEPDDFNRPVFFVTVFIRYFLADLTVPNVSGKLAALPRSSTHPVSLRNERCSNRIGLAQVRRGGPVEQVRPALRTG